MSTLKTERICEMHKLKRLILSMINNEYQELLNVST